MVNPDALDAKFFRELTQAIRGVAHAERIVLFGSFARGDAGPESDIDLLIISDTPYGPQHSRRKEAARIWRALARFGRPVDLLLYSREEVEKWACSENHVTSRALREGRELHG